MRISDFVNALADNPESNIVHDDEWEDCDHDWEVRVEERAVGVYSVTQGADGLPWSVQYEGSEDGETTELIGVVCRDCGIEPDDGTLGMILSAVGIGE